MPVQEIEELKNRFVEQLSPLQVYLFGSFATGTSREDSDFDFYIVVDDDSPDLVDLTVEAYKAIRYVRTRPVDILVGKKSRFETLKNMPTVEREVYRKGVLLYGE